MVFQKTIKKEIIVSGARQSDGKDTHLTFLPADSGLWVRYKGSIEPLDVFLMNENEKRLTNSITIGGEVIAMVEHVFSAVYGLGIDAAIIEFDSNEAPFFASARVFAEALANYVIEISGAEKVFLEVYENIEVMGKDGQYCRITPSDVCEIDISIDFENIIGKQRFVYVFGKDDYVKEIAFARSFLVFEVLDPENPWMDFKKHFDTFPCTLSNGDPKKSPYIAYTDKEFLTPLRDTLEPVRHKLLDFIGDMIFLGSLPKAKIKLYKPGHAFNREVVKAILSHTDMSELYFDHFFKKIPEIESLDTCIENNSVHKNESVFLHTKSTFKNAFDIANTRGVFSPRRMYIFLLAVFLHDYGKKHTLRSDDEGNTSCCGHEEVTLQKVVEEGILERFELTQQEKERVLGLMRCHSDMHAALDDVDMCERKISEFKNLHQDDFLENIVFSIADLKGTFFKVNNPDEYNRRMSYLRDALEICRK